MDAGGTSDWKVDVGDLSSDMRERQIGDGALAAVAQARHRYRADREPRNLRRGNDSDVQQEIFTERRRVSVLAN